MASMTSFIPCPREALIKRHQGVLSRILSLRVSSIERGVPVLRILAGYLLITDKNNRITADKAVQPVYPASVKIKNINDFDNKRVSIADCVQDI